MKSGFVASMRTRRSALLLNLLFANEPLSIQVHPNDNFARSIGLPHGKIEARYSLSAAPGAKAALGLKHLTTARQLRALQSTMGRSRVWCAGGNFRRVEPFSFLPALSMRSVPAS